MSYDHYQTIQPCVGCGRGIKTGPRVICDVCYKGMKLEGTKKKFVLEFDEVPAFVFVSYDGRKEEIYKHGERVRQWLSLELRSSLDEITTHTIEYVTIKSDQ